MVSEPGADREARVVYVNGKFVAQRTTGVQRVATALLQALDTRVPAGRFVLLCPPGGDAPVLHNIAVRRVGPRGLALHLWEQAVLPWAARDGWLLSLAGAAPAFARRHLAMLHDAAVFDCPWAYRPAFVRWYRWLFRRLGRRAVALLTVSEFSRQRLQAVLQPAAPIFVVRNGADHLQDVVPDASVLARLGVAGRPFVLAVGSSNPSKNLPALVRAHALLGPDAPPLVVAGGRRDRVFGDVHWPDTPGLVLAGPMNDAELVALYRAATLMAFPSLYEGFGLPPLEAMQHGCPVIVAPIPALLETCGSAAACFDGTDPQAIARGLRTLLDDPARRRVLAQQGREHAATRRWDAAAGELLDVLLVTGAVPELS